MHLLNEKWCIMHPLGLFVTVSEHLRVQANFCQLTRNTVTPAAVINFFWQRYKMQRSYHGTFPAAVVIFTNWFLISPGE